MKKLLSFIFILSSLYAHAQSELPGDTIKDRLPVIKEQIPSSPKGNTFPKRTGTFDESQPEQGFQQKQQDSITMDLTPPPFDYIEPLPWADMEKIPFKSDPYDMDYQRYAEFLLSPQVILQMYSDHTTYTAMGSIMQAGAGVTYYSPNERWELSGGIYAANYSMPTPSALSMAQYARPGAPRGTQWDMGVNASIAYRINDRIRIRAFGQYSGYGRSNSFHGYMNPSYPQSNYGMVMELKVTNWLDIVGGMERVYDPTKMKWKTVPVIFPVIHFGK